MSFRRLYVAEIWTDESPHPQRPYNRDLPQEHQSGRVQEDHGEAFAQGAQRPVHSVRWQAFGRFDRTASGGHQSTPKEVKCVAGCTLTSLCKVESPFIDEALVLQAAACSPPRPWTLIWRTCHTAVDGKSKYKLGLNLGYKLGSHGCNMEFSPLLSHDSLAESNYRSQTCARTERLGSSQADRQPVKQTCSM